MCGICGIKLPEHGPIGRYLVDMCQAMRHRGYDSTGFALYGEPVAADRPAPAHRRGGHTRAALDALEGSLRERGVTLAEEHDRRRAGAPDRFVRATVARPPTKCATSCVRSTRPARHRGPVDRPLARDRQGPRRRATPSTRATASRRSSARTASATCASRPSRSSTSPTATPSGPSRSPTSRSSTTARSRTTSASAAC